jgi:hypothetical protein
MLHADKNKRVYLSTHNDANVSAANDKRVKVAQWLAEQHFNRIRVDTLQDVVCRSSTLYENMCGINETTRNQGLVDHAFQLDLDEACVCV